MKERDTSLIDCIVIHHSASEFGNAEEIRKWHMMAPRNWSDIGYNSVILNCYPTSDSYLLNAPDINSDGKEEEGRDPKYIPAGVRGHNMHTVHICLIGDKSFTSAQLITLRTLVEYYKGFYPNIKKVVRHCDLDEKKPTCPGISRKFLRELLA